MAHNISYYPRQPGTRLPVPCDVSMVVDCDVVSSKQGVLTLMAVERPEEFEHTPTDNYQDNYR